MTWSSVNCLRTETVLASRSGTSTHVTLYWVPGWVASDRSATCVPPAEQLIACSVPAVSPPGTERELAQRALAVRGSRFGGVQRK